ncbi:MAG: UPF0182 family protein [Fimbriimonadaceae bacterium]|nr:UPF0182 family protein [Fimbriimonadaceae bacterium]
MDETRFRFESPADQQAVRKASKAGIGCLTAIVLLVIGMSIVRPYTDFLWFSHDARHPEVFTIGYATKGLLFSIAFVFGVLFIYANLSRALKIAPVFNRIPESPTEQALVQIFDWVQTRTWAPKVIALVFGFSYASAFAGEWQSYLLWKNSVPFGKTDPLFGLDLSFYVFRLPFWEAMLGLLFGIIILTTVLSAVISYGLAALAKAGNIKLDQRQSNAHTMFLIGLSLMALAGKFWLSRYGFTVTQSAQFFGAGYAATQQLQMVTVMSGLTAVGGIAAWLMMKSTDSLRRAIWIASGLAGVWFLGVAVWPSVVQRFKVDPNKLNVEAPYATRAIEMTRWAYGLDTIAVSETNVRVGPTDEEVAASQPTLDQMRLWDPEVLRRSIDSLQGFRTYYSFNDVDVDRYVINGKQQQVMVAARDVRIEGLQSQAQNWVNQRLQYTHGYGVAMAPTNTATRIGQPSFIAKDLPVVSIPDIPIEQPRIYFSDFRDAGGGQVDPYALVKTKVPEFDYPTETESGSKTYKWTGDRGVPVGGLLAKLAFSILFSDGNLLVSPNIVADSRILYRRNVTERCEKIYPFLRFDEDPYVVVFGGKFYWILDGYTTSGSVPYSDQLIDGGRRINYIRNSVKVTVDAYSGETTAYAIEPDEPILKAYRKIYPNLVKDIGSLPKGLEEHFRYPEDMFLAQAIQLVQYHVTNPIAFLNNEDAWEMPHEIGLEGQRAPMQPYYVQMQLPNSPKDEFILILPFTPRQKNNMAGWLAAPCDPENYGKLSLNKYPKGSNIPGPAQIESKFNQDNEIANLNKLLNSEQSKIVPGNLLIVPLGQSILYVKPLFIQSSIAAIPELRKVILSTNDNVVVADTYQQALNQLLGTTNGQARTQKPPEVGTKPAAGNEPSTSADQTLLRQALDYLRQAETAQRAGDWAKYGEMQKKALETLEKMVR